VDKTTGLRFDQTVGLTGRDAQHDYPVPMRRTGYRDPETGKALVFLTNNFTVPALTIAKLYRGRWQIELFFKWIKPHLRIKAFYGTSPITKHRISSMFTGFLNRTVVERRMKVCDVIVELPTQELGMMSLSQRLTQFRMLA
jgi:hypothetical protein